MVKRGRKKHHDLRISDEAYRHQHRYRSHSRRRNKRERWAGRINKDTYYQELDWSHLHEQPLNLELNPQPPQLVLQKSIRSIPQSLFWTCYCICSQLHRVAAPQEDTQTPTNYLISTFNDLCDIVIKLGSFNCLFWKIEKSSKMIHILVDAVVFRTSSATPKQWSFWCLVCSSFWFFGLELLLARVSCWCNNIDGPKASKRLKSLSGVRFKCTMSWCSAWFSRCLGTLCYFIPTFSHFDAFFDLKIGDSWVLSLSIIVVTLVVYFVMPLSPASLKRSDFPNIFHLILLRYATFNSILFLIHLKLQIYHIIPRLRLLFLM